jgi:hypothetical protein
MQLAFRALFLAALVVSACQTPPQATAETIQPTYGDISTKVFSNCTTRSCHGEAGAKGGLILTADKAYDQLVGVAADNEAAKAKGKIRVVAGDPEASFLLQKLTGPGAGEGDLMPQRGEKLPEAQLEAIRGWIKAGAKR